MFGISGGHRIDPAFMPWMALTQPANGEVAPFYDPVFCDGFLRITGAGGVKAAMVAQKRTDQQLVTGNDLYKEAAHQDSRF